MLRRVMEEIERGLQRGVIDKDGGVGVFVLYPGDEGGAFGRNCKVAATVNDAGQRLFGEVAGAGDDVGAVVLQLGDERRANARCVAASHVLWRSGGIFGWGFWVCQARSFQSALVSMPEPDRLF